MTNYKKVADIMQQMSVDTKILSKKDFEKIAKNRELSFIQVIDKTGDSQREVWGNRNFEVIILHNTKTSEFQIL